MRALIGLLFAVFVLLSNPARAFELYLYIPTITGESSTPGFPGDIRLLTYDFMEPTKSVLVTKLVDSTSPAFFAATLTGKVIPVIDVLVYNVSGAEAQPDNIFQYSGSIFSQDVLEPGSSPTVEDLTFNYTIKTTVPELSRASFMAIGLLAVAVIGWRRKRA